MEAGAQKNRRAGANIKSEPKVTFPLDHPQVHKSDVERERKSTEEKLWAIEMSVSGYARFKKFCYTLAAHLDDISPTTKKTLEYLSGNYDARMAIRKTTLVQLGELATLANQYQERVYQETNLAGAQELFLKFHSAIEAIIKLVQHPDIQKQLKDWQEKIFKPTVDAIRKAKLSEPADDKNLVPENDKDLVTVYVAIRGLESTFSSEVMNTPAKREEVLQRTFVRVNDRIGRDSLNVYNDAKQCLASEFKGSIPSKKGDIVVALQIPKSAIIKTQPERSYIKNSFVSLKNIASAQKVAQNYNKDLILEKAVTNPTNVVPIKAADLRK